MDIYIGKESDGREERNGGEGKEFSIDSASFQSSSTHREELGV